MKRLARRMAPKRLARAGWLASLFASSMLAPVSSFASPRSQFETLPRSQFETLTTSPLIPLEQSVTARAVMMPAHAETLRPAPLPDPDISAPGPTNDALAAQADPSLTPGLFNQRSHFAGDGYEPGSSIEADHTHRHSTGGGMNLSIPMQ